MKKAKHQSWLLERLGLKKKQQSLIPLGVGWYTAENWAHAKETAADPEKFEATFEEWNIMAEDALRKMADAGISPLKVLIDVEQLLGWCRTNDKPNDGAARAQFVSHQVRRHATGT